MGRRIFAPRVWSAAQRGVLAALVGFMLALIVWRAAADRGHLDDPPQPNPQRARNLADRVDLNIADLDTLVTLPGIGPSRAQTIIAYRQSVERRGSGEPAFTKAEDLLYIDGFGMATIDLLRPHLAFGSVGDEEGTGR